MLFDIFGQAHKMIELRPVDFSDLIKGPQTRPRRGAVGRHPPNDGSKGWRDQHLAQRFSLPRLGLLRKKWAVKRQLLPVALDFEGDRIALASDNSPLNAGTHAPPFCHRFTVDFYDAIARTQHAIRWRIAVHL